ncbi:SagB/ThcOx family dehydrogenase [Clostridium gasigenes]|uniref:SagB/ThcOx family dehydrogenase n=1 Tax=Clostridium gasigenes TaxID=94869 RepID=UPI001628C2D1|nr:SagB/ThcOx family dehydrogenase [Clostridium gasigenes]MBB6625540.1 SagB/ThcOx family dehydrogenase [Clostridium gasigenes]
MDNNLKRKTKRNIFEEGKYFWSPVYNWKESGDIIQIGIFGYDDIALKMFPNLYYYTQDGITIQDLTRKFDYLEEEKIKNFLSELVNNNILVKEILSPKQVFVQQEKLLQLEIDEDTFINPALYEEYKSKQLRRTFSNVLTNKIKLLDSNYEDSIKRRRSIRKFNENDKISFEKFSNIISVFKQYRTEDNMIRYNYATDGGLYPIDIFIYLKENRIEDVKGGLYYFNPIENELRLVSNTCVITDTSHYASNKEIFNSAAFSLFLVYNAEVTMPKYQGMGYLYAAIDTGIMVQLLTQVCEVNNIGVCSIGEMDFSKIAKYFKLEKNQVLIHTVEVGLK